MRNFEKDSEKYCTQAKRNDLIHIIESMFLHLHTTIGFLWRLVYRHEIRPIPMYDAEEVKRLEDVKRHERFVIS